MLGEGQQLTPEETGRKAFSETEALMVRMRDDAAKLGVDLPALLTAEYAARPPVASPARPAVVCPVRPRPRLVFSRD